MTDSRLQAVLSSNLSDPVVIAGALGLAFFLGAAHALSPGHGKALVAAYLTGRGGRWTDAVWLGIVVTATHTASVFVLGLITLYAAQRVLLDRIYPWLSLVSAILVTGLGGWLLWRRLRPQEHHHHHDHSHEHHHHHHHELIALGVSGGLVPCPEALVLLLLSVSLRRLPFGLLILAFFSLGLAAVLVGIGLAMISAGPALQRITGERRWTHALPLASAGVVTAVGLLMLWQAGRTF